MRPHVRGMITCLALLLCSFTMSYQSRPARADTSTTPLDFAENIHSKTYQSYGTEVTLDHGQTWVAPGEAGGGRVSFIENGYFFPATVGSAHMGYANVPVLTRWTPNDVGDHDNGIQMTIPNGSCQNGVALANRASRVNAIIAVCATPTSNGGSQIAIDIFDFASTWGGWQVIGGWSDISAGESVPVPSVAYDGGENVMILAQSPTTHAIWYTTYTWGGSTTPWYHLPATSCTSTPLVVYRPGSHDFPIACIASDTQSMWANTLTPGTTPLGSWYQIGAKGGGFTDIALAYDATAPGSAIYFSGLGHDHVVYTYTATNAITYPLISGWQTEFVGPDGTTGPTGDPELVGIASFCPIPPGKYQVH